MTPNHTLSSYHIFYQHQIGKKCSEYLGSDMWFFEYKGALGHLRLLIGWSYSAGSQQASALCVLFQLLHSFYS